MGVRESDVRDGQISRERCLGLVPDTVFKWDGEFEFFLVEADRFLVEKPFVLLARHSGAIPLFARCLFPYDIIFEELQ